MVDGVQQPPCSHEAANQNTLETGTGERQVALDGAIRLMAAVTCFQASCCERKITHVFKLILLTVLVAEGRFISNRWRTKLTLTATISWNSLCQGLCQALLMPHALLPAQEPDGTGPVIVPFKRREA